jgi:hypothetical protein
MWDVHPLSQSHAGLSRTSEQQPSRVRLKCAEARLRGFGSRCRHASGEELWVSLECDPLAADRGVQVLNVGKELVVHLPNMGVGLVLGRSMQAPYRILLYLPKMGMEPMLGRRGWS